MPTASHRLDYPSNDILSTFLTTGRIQLLEIVLAILATIKLVEETFIERSEALSTHKTVLVEQLPVTVHHLLIARKLFITHTASI